MRDNELIQLMRPLLLAGFAAQGLTTVQVKQNYQPTQQGRVGVPPAMYLTKVIDHRHGSPRIAYNWLADAVPPVLQRTKTTIIEGHWQFAFTATEDPANDDELTAADYAKIAASIMQDRPFMDGLLVGGVQIFRIIDINTLNVQNDRDEYEKNVTFDAIITHKDIEVTESPTVGNIKAGIYPV